MGLPIAEEAASIKAHNDEEATSVQGTPMYLWQHKGCPGPHNKGCFKMSVYQGETITDAMRLQCHLRDANLGHVKVRPYRLQPNLKFWTRLSSKNNAYHIALAGKQWLKAMSTDAGYWVNGELPTLECR